MPRKLRSILSATLVAGALLAAVPAATPARAETGAAASDGATSIHRSTRGVNAAILGLGALWVLLMVRRIQSVAALRHAEAGH
jgi:hypothetical protein